MKKAIRGRYAAQMKIRLQYLIDHPDCDDHRSATQKVAERFGMDPLKVEKTLKRFFARMNRLIQHQQKIVLKHHFTVDWTEQGRREMTIKERKAKAMVRKKMRKARRKTAHFKKLEREYYSFDNLHRIYRDC